MSIWDNDFVSNFDILNLWNISADSAESKQN